MNIVLDFITGVSLGFEYVEEMGEPKTIIVDLLIFRIMFQWE